MTSRHTLRILLPALLISSGIAVAADDPEVIKGKLPPNWPKDVAVYTDAKPETYTDDGDRIVLTLSLAAAPEKITAFYKEQMVKDGWKQTMTVGNLVEFTKADRKTSLHSFKNEQDGTSSLIIDYRKK